MNTEKEELKDKIKSLLEQEEKLLASALIKTMKAYNENPTLSNLRDYEAAKRALEEFQKRKAAMENPESSEENQEFKTLLQIFKYLKNEGWKISKSALYEKAYMIKKTNGVYLKKDIDAFAKKFLRKIDAPDIDIEDGIDKKIQAEIRKLTAEAEKKELEVKKLRGELVERWEVEQQLADRAAFLKSSIQEFFHSMAPYMIEKVEGNIQKLPEFIEFCLIEIEKLFDYYSRPLQFIVPAMENQEDISEEGT